jgi:hypothetical protein
MSSPAAWNRSQARLTVRKRRVNGKVKRDREKESEYDPSEKGRKM